MSSFFNERTAEYALLPRLQRALESEFGSAVPIFYWKTREGNRQSATIHRGACFRLLAMFARRPKTTDQPSRIAGKLNRVLFEFAEAAREEGIVTIASFPAVRSLFELHAPDATTIWFLLRTTRNSDYTFHVHLSDPPSYEGRPDRAFQVLPLSQIVEHIREESRIFSWDDAMDVVSELRHTQHDEEGAFPFFGIGGYKPVYVLMEDRIV